MRAFIHKTTGEIIDVIASPKGPSKDDTFIAEVPEGAEVGDFFEAGKLVKKVLPYAEARQREYPPIGDQLDAIMKWLSTETEFTVPAELKSLAMKCMSVKAKYPKPTEGK